MVDEFLLVQKLLASIVVGYLLGSIPFAHLAARVKGVDIFATGSKQAGTANVFWNINRRTGVLVFSADVGKGAMAIIIAGLLGIAQPLVLVAGGAAILGHWNSIFASFRGGDGMAALIGITLAVEPTLALAALGVGLVTLIIVRRSHYRSAAGLATGAMALLGVSQYYQVGTGPVLGLVALYLLVLGHNIAIHRRRSRRGRSDSPDDDTEVPDLPGPDDHVEVDSEMRRARRISDN